MRRSLLTLLPLLLMCASSPPPAPLPFKVMAYNVLYDSTEMDASLDTIEAQLPDILCLTELTPSFARSFSKRLGKQYPHRYFVPHPGTWGVGIASRHPLENPQHFPVKPHRIPAADADVKLVGRRVKVSCVHLMAPVAKHKKSDDLFTTLEKNAELRTKQGATLVKRYERERGQILLLGDMNEGKPGGAMKAFGEAGFIHACTGPDSSCGPTWPRAAVPLPMGVEIDHILGRGLTFAEAEVLYEGGSDHFPVQARFDFAPPPAQP